MLLRPPPQVAGLRFTFSTTAPKNQRVLEVTVRMSDGSYAPIDPCAYYTLVTNNFQADGERRLQPGGQVRSAPVALHHTQMAPWARYVVHCSACGRMTMRPQSRQKCACVQMRALGLGEVLNMSVKCLLAQQQTAWRSVNPLPPTHPLSQVP